jgi:hypothetical protein
MALLFLFLLFFLLVLGRPTLPPYKLARVYVYVCVCVVVVVVSCVNSERMAAASFFLIMYSPLFCQQMRCAFQCGSSFIIGILDLPFFKASICRPLWRNHFLAPPFFVCACFC